MRVKINGRGIEPGDKVTFDNTEYSDGMAYVIIIAGAALIYWIIKGGLFV
jgi:hypothetical protein